MGVQVNYSLTETVLRVRAQNVAVKDPYVNGNEPVRRVEDLKVEVVNVADRNNAATAAIERGDRELSATLTSDGRLQSLTYNSVGAGSKVVSGVAKLIAYVGSLIVGAGRGGRPAGEADPDAAPPDQEDWEKEHAKEHALRTSYVDVYDTAATQLATLRKQIIEASDLAALRTLGARAGAVEQVMRQALGEVTRIDRLRAEWRESKRTTVSSDLQTVVRFDAIPERTATDLKPPSHPDEGQPGYELWRDFQLVVEQRGGVRVQLTDDYPSTLDEPHFVFWRIPREVDLWIWKQSGDDELVLVSRETIWVCDEHSLQDSMRLSTAIFGEHGGELAFNDDGRPGSLRHKQESALGSFVDSLAGATDAVAGGVAKAKETADAFIALGDLQAERARTAAVRDLEVAKNRLELKGVHATEADYAELQQAEQAVTLKTARQALAPTTPDLLAGLKRELETVTTRNAIAAERRSAEVDVELASLRTDLARLELQQHIDRAQPGTNEQDR